MPELPTGTITFVFTDIERSTALLESLGERYAAVLERHNDLIRTAFARHGAVEVSTEGDAFFVVFRAPAGAIKATVEAQRTLHQEAWPQNAPVRVRMGLHTGEGVRGGDNYVGLDVHRASRIASAAHGGQVLISDATRALVEQALPDGVSLRDLGRHRLKGLPRVEHIYQVDADGLAFDFAPISSLEVRPNNLPREVTSFVGREEQIREIKDRLLSARLLTLTGPAGTGKTRLGIRVAEEVIAEFEHGCWFVALDALRDPELVPAEISSALGINVPGDKPVLSVLRDSLAERELLLVLDNFEQVLPAAQHVRQLLNEAPRVRVLTTSRTPLHIYGEQEYPVPPLSGAHSLATTRATVESLSQYEAVQLFIERALAVKPDFRVTNANAPAVAEICNRLDGLPLAIELAAARVKLLTPEQILTRLERSLSLLASQAQDLPERQRTLHGAIDWSYALLSGPEQRLFACLSIFRGGFTLDAVDEVCRDEIELDTFDGLASLVDKSLLHTEEDAAEARFTMLETIRAYAREQLIDSGDADELARRHAAYFLTLALDAQSRLVGPHQRQWLETLQREHDNLRAAFDRAADVDMIEEALTAAGSAWRFFQLGGHFAEGRAVLERLLRHAAGPAARAKALTGAGGIAYWQGDFEAMSRHYREARELYEAVGDLHGIAEAYHNESYVPILLRGDLESGQEMLEKAIGLYRQAGDELGVAEAESMLGFAHYFQGEPEAAIPYQARAVEAYRAAGATWQLSENLFGLGTLYAQVGDWPRAVSLARESLALANEMTIEIGLAMIFEGLGGAAAWVGDVERGVLLLGKAAAMTKELGASAPSQFLQTELFRQKARDDLGDARYEQLHSEGAALTTAEAVRLVEEFEPPPDAERLPPMQPWGQAAEQAALRE